MCAIHSSSIISIIVIVLGIVTHQTNYRVVQAFPDGDGIAVPAANKLSPCGLFGLSIFCFNGCGFFGRLFGLCASPNSPTRAPNSQPIPSPNSQPIPSPNKYDITLDFDDDSVPTADRADFIAAAQRWEEIIVGDVEDVPISDLARFPPVNSGCSYPTDTGFIDDLYMCIFFERLSDGVVGVGGYIYIRDNGIPVSGFTQIDPDAIETARQFGYFNDLLLHEFGHAIGVGTAGPCPSDNANSMANLEYQKLSQCTTPIPTQSSCGHYTEECLGSELMTPMLAIDDSPLSRITVAWAEDIGYEVNYDAADPFDSSELGTAVGCNCNRRTLRTIGNSSSDSSNSDKSKNDVSDNVRYLGLQKLSMTETGMSRSSSIISTTTTNRMMQQQPKLSTTGYNSAIKSGITFLNGQKIKRNQYDNAIRSNSTTATSNVLFVGDQLVWVYIRENDHVHSVLVRSSDAL